MVEKSFDNLSPSEVKEHWAKVEEGIRKEVRSFSDMDTLELQLASKAHNVLSSRWVLKWKLVEGVRLVKARLTVRGFEDMAENLSTFASTASRWGQRVVSVIATQMSWPLFLADVSTAFLQGLTFEELAKLNGGQVREVCFQPPANSAQYFKELKGMESYNPPVCMSFA